MVSAPERREATPHEDGIRRVVHMLPDEATDEQRQILLDLVFYSVHGVAEKHGIDRTTVYRTLERYEREYKALVAAKTDVLCSLCESSVYSGLHLINRKLALLTEDDLSPNNLKNIASTTSAAAKLLESLKAGADQSDPEDKWRQLNRDATKALATVNKSRSTKQ